MTTCQSCGKEIVRGMTGVGDEILLDPGPPIYAPVGNGNERSIPVRQHRGAMVAHRATCSEKDIVKQLTRWIVRNSESESVLLYSDPQHMVNAYYLLHHLAEITGTDDQQMEAWVDEANKEPVVDWDDI